MAICNMDCLNCVYSDCINEAEPTKEEMQAQDEYDRYLMVDELKDQARIKGNISHWKYNHSSKGKAAQKRYAQSEKGKEAQRKQTQKKIKSGKNAEYCRRYYWKKKGIVV